MNSKKAPPPLLEIGDKQGGGAFQLRGAFLRIIALILIKHRAKRGAPRSGAPSTAKVRFYLLLEQPPCWVQKCNAFGPENVTLWDPHFGPVSGWIARLGSILGPQNGVPRDFGATVEVTFSGRLNFSESPFWAQK